MKSEEEQFAEWVGNRIIEARIEVKQTQQKLAVAINVSRGTLINFEKGRQCPTLYILWKIAQQLHKDLTFFIPLNDEHNPLKSISDDKLSVFDELNNSNNTLSDSSKSLISKILKKKLTKD